MIRMALSFATLEVISVEGALGMRENDEFGRAGNESMVVIWGTSTSVHGWKRLNASSRIYTGVQG